jgi:hypothetical protein
MSSGLFCDRSNPRELATCLNELRDILEWKVDDEAFEPVVGWFKSSSGFSTGEVGGELITINEMVDSLLEDVWEEEPWGYL